MPDISRIRALAFRAVLTMTCLAGAGISLQTTKTAAAQTVRRCPNTGCVGIDRCYFYGGISCSMTAVSCTNTVC
jgi:hypothetical protein